MKENSMKLKQIHIGIDLGGSKIEGVIMKEGFQNAPDPAQYILTRKRIPTHSENGYDFILHRVLDFINDLMNESGGEPRQTTIGVGLPGSIARKTGQVKNSNTTCLNGKPFWLDIQRLLHSSVAFENDANCFALAESVWGAAKDYSSVFGVILGSGVGGGIIHDRTIHSGRHNIAGEWGHTLLIPGGRPCYCGKQGCVETYLSGPAFERYSLTPYNFNMTAKEFNRTWQESDFPNRKRAELIVDSYCDYFGMAMSNVINILDPDVIVLGGGVSNFSFLYNKGIRAVEKYIFNDELLTPIKPAVLGDSAGVFGAAYLGAVKEEL